MFETVASANWATGACSPDDTGCAGVTPPRPPSDKLVVLVQNQNDKLAEAWRTIAAVSKRSITKKLGKISRRLTSLRADLGTIDEQTRHLRDDADDMAVEAIVADNTGVTREARRAREHAEAHRKNRDRVLAEIRELEQRQDELLDQLGASG